MEFTHKSFREEGVVDRGSNEFVWVEQRGDKGIPNWAPFTVFGPYDTRAVATFADCRDAERYCAWREETG